MGFDFLQPICADAVVLAGRVAGVSSCRGNSVRSPSVPEPPTNRLLADQASADPFHCMDDHFNVLGK